MTWNKAGWVAAGLAAGVVLGFTLAPQAQSRGGSVGTWQFVRGDGLNVFRGNTATGALAICGRGDGKLECIDFPAPKS